MKDWKERNLTKEEKEAFIIGYAKDMEVVGEFYYRETETDFYRLYFKDGTQIIAEFLTCADSDNGLELDDPYYEDLYEFYFIVKIIEKQGSELNFKKGEGIALNYHNFFDQFEPYFGEI